MPSCTGCTKPMASSTRSALSSNSLPGTGLHLAIDADAVELLHLAVLAGEGLGHDGEVALGALPAGSTRCAASTASPARSAALFSCSGGIGMISSWVTESAPWRIEVPMQSEPVSPPPITTTCLPSARIGSVVERRLLARRGGSAAAGNPWRSGCRARSRPGIGRSRGFSAPPASSTASKLSTELPGVLA